MTASRNRRGHAETPGSFGGLGPRSTRLHPTDRQGGWEVWPRRVPSLGRKPLTVSQCPLAQSLS